ncbi:MAG: DUF2721 domain-containing protein [Spirochaetales bacterium]|uniref:DUF2721 domain-containing protein n=1 Tax=Candidatus Thalassospirochaeta sargassi TaxID=3119039 RepID=A0AAJ1MIJ9_9SPIO|nr:DUF2721 domain-containing protein [Spirochaetales bacterium]
MNFTLTTPALLFPAISLLLLAYTNRYLTIAGLIRNLFSENEDNKNRIYTKQIANLRKRINIIKNMQILGVMSFFCCVLTMMLLFFGLPLAGEIIFGVSLALLLLSLGLSIYEITISVGALNILLDSCCKD